MKRLKFTALWRFAVPICAVICLDAFPPISGQTPVEKERTVQIAGKHYSLQESIPVISAMAKSANEVEREQAMEAARVWGPKLKGSVLVPEIIDRFKTETVTELKLLSLATLCTIADERALGAFKLAADSTNVFFQAAGVVGMAEFQPGEALPRLLDCMLVSTNAVVINEVLMAMEEIAGNNVPLPATMETWTSKSAKEKYRREFLQWWQANKNRCLAEWEAKHRVSPISPAIK